jgi:hypothetical protein
MKCGILTYSTISMNLTSFHFLDIPISLKSHKYAKVTPQEKTARPLRALAVFFMQLALQ